MNIDECMCVQMGVGPYNQSIHTSLRAALFEIPPICCGACSVLIIAGKRKAEASSQHHGIQQVPAMGATMGLVNTPTVTAFRPRKQAVNNHGVVSSLSQKCDTLINPRKPGDLFSQVLNAFCPVLQTSYSLISLKRGYVGECYSMHLEFRLQPRFTSHVL